MSRVLDANMTSEDEQEISLRPITLDEYIGQTHLKDNLRVYMGAAKTVMKY